MSDKALAHALEYGTFRVLSAFLRALPEGLAQRLGAGLGWVVGSVLRIRRDVVERNLALAFPDRTARWRARTASASYVHLGREAVAVLRLAGLAAPDMRVRTSVVGLEELREALAEGRGAVLVTGHLGNWEIAGAALAVREVPLLAVAKGMANRRFGEALTAARERLGVRTVDVSRAPRDVMRALRGGGAVALVADQNAREFGLLVPFFGVRASTARGPAVFAIRARCPLFLGVMLRHPGWRPRYQLTLERIDVERTGDSEWDVLALTTAHTAALERAVRAAPEQYFWQHKRWRKHAGTMPGEEPPQDAPV
jgi:KDO2-lipid IV(A) lauroyltransferase